MAAPVDSSSNDKLPIGCPINSSSNVESMNNDAVPIESPVNSSSKDECMNKNAVPTECPVPASSNKAMSTGCPVDSSSSEAVPIGWRFDPTEEELVLCYLSKRVARKDVPAAIIKEIDACEFYNHHPKDLTVEQNVGMECYFFIKGDKYFHGKVEKEQAVGDGIGMWRYAGKEEPVFDSNGKLLAYKIHSTFFLANAGGFRRTEWRMEEYRLTNNDQQQELPREECVVARIRRGFR